MANRNIPLLVAFIFGAIMFLILLACLIISILPIFDGMSLLKVVKFSSDRDSIKVKIFVIMLPILLIIHAGGLVLNFLGWLRDDCRMAFIAAFLYIPSMPGTTVPMILCFIGYSQLK